MEPGRLLACLFAFIWVLTGSESVLADDSPSPRPLGREHPVFSAPRDPDESLVVAPALSGEITLADAVSAALQGSPALAALSFDVRSREALAIQAAARPNPSLALEVEDFGGTGNRSSFDSAQTTLSLAQVIELGGKRAGRMRLAEVNTALASWDFETRRLAVLTDTTKAFVVVLALQERQALVEDLARIAEETLRSVASTVKAGAVSPVEEDRARVNLGRVDLEVARNSRELEAARALLASVWGESRPHFDRVRGALDDLPPVPALEQLNAVAPESPDLARWNAEVAQREAALSLERVRRIPDVTLLLGGRYYADDHDTGLVAGVSVPLPLFDRNRGNILDTRYRVARAQAERRLADVSVRSAIAASYQDLLIASGEVKALREDIVPRAERVFTETRRGYSTGVFRYVEVLDAERTLFDARRELLAALAAFRFAATDLERLTGTPLSELSGRSNP